MNMLLIRTLTTMLAELLGAATRVAICGAPPRATGGAAPVRATSRQGIVIGQDGVAKGDAAEAIAAPRTDRKARRRWSRLFRR
mgnify:CR=1 FL=1